MPRVRVRTSTKTVDLDVAMDTTVGQFKATVLEKINIPVDAQSFKSGYPPVEVIPEGDGSKFFDTFKRGEVVYIESTQKEQRSSTSSTTTQANPVPSASARGPAPTSIVSQGTFVVRKVPDDNSCLFHAVSALLGGRYGTKVGDLRQIVADAVGSERVTYNEVFLGRPNDEYRAWILSDAAWGGAIELGILARYFQVELGAFDVQTMRLDRYGEGNSFKTIGYLIYSGIHYDYLALALDTNMRDADICQFDTNDTDALLAAKELCNTAHVAGQWTNTQTFQLKCEICKVRLRGEKEATEHGKATGHSNFSEWRD